MNDLLIDGVAFFTERGSSSVTPNRALFGRPNRLFEINAVVQTDAQYQKLLSVMRGRIVSVTWPDGTVLPTTLVSVESVPGPRRPLVVHIRVFEQA